MNELVKAHYKKTGIPAATAQTVIEMVIDFIKKKLPTPMGKQIDGILSNDAAIKKAENVVWTLASNLRKK